MDGAAPGSPVPRLFMEEEGHRLHCGLQQAQGERGPEVARDGVSHHGCNANVDEVVAGGLHQHGFVLVCDPADVGHGGLHFFSRQPWDAVNCRDGEIVVILNSKDQLIVAKPQIAAINKRGPRSSTCAVYCA